MNLGVIGLGNMGLPISERLVRYSNCPVYGFDIVQSSVNQFAEAGGMPLDTAEELFAKCEIVFLSLPSNELVHRNLLLGIEYAKKGSIIIDTSSCTPDVICGCAEKAAERGVEFIDCPVSGGVQGAVDGTLSAMCGGNKMYVARVMPLLQIFAKHVTYMGPLGSGYTTKIINNLIVGGEITLLAEAFGLAQRSGLDPTRVKDAICSGAAGSPVMEIKVPKMIERDFTPSSRVLIHLKDLHNAQSLAKTLHTHVPACDQSVQLLEELVDQGRGNEDVAAAIDLF